MEKLMSYRRSMEQLRPARTQKIDLQEKVQQLFLTEGADTPIKTQTDAKKFIIKSRNIQYKGLQDLVKFLQQKRFVPQDKVILAYDKNNGTFKIRYEPKNQREKQAIEKEMARLISLEKLPNRKTVYGKGSGAANPTTSSKNVKGGDVKSPTGAEWEDCICYYYNNPAPRSSTDSGANKKDEAYPIASKFFGTQYEQQGRKLGKAFKGLLKDNTSMKPLGGGGKKVTRSLTSIYTKSGASNTIPKTDMYTGSYQISLKKKGGSQLASAAKGETKGMFNAALEHFSGNTEKINDILEAIDENFTKLSTDMTKTQLANVGSGKEDKEGNIAPEKKDLSPEDKKAFKQFLSTEKFHKDLNKQIEKDLNFDNNKEFIEFLCYEAMSGHKKFNENQPKASICIEFDPGKGIITKSIKTTPSGKPKFAIGAPKISKDISTLAGKVKLYAAWKSSSGDPYSSFRFGVPAMKESRFLNQQLPTLKQIVISEIKKDKIMNALLTEGTCNLHEINFDPIGAIKKAYDKVKGLAGTALAWIQGLVSKIMAAVRKTLDGIKQMGKDVFTGIFKFLGIELDKADVTPPGDVAHFFNK